LGRLEIKLEDENNEKILLSELVNSQQYTIKELNNKIKKLNNVQSNFSMFFFITGMWAIQASSYEIKELFLQKKHFPKCFFF
jgi:hypothetical protein